MTDELGRVIDFHAVARVSTRVNLRDVRIRSCFAESKMEPSEVPEGWSGRAWIASRTDVLDAGPAPLTTRAAFLVFYHGDTDYSEAGAEPNFEREADVVIEVEIDLLYDLRGDDPLAPNDAEHFAVANGTLHAWPYWRELAHSLSTRMQVPRVLVGVFKLPSADDPPDSQPGADAP